MAAEWYKGRTLIVTPRYETDREQWTAHVAVTWREGEKTHVCRLDGPFHTFNAREEAIADGLRLARLWVDKSSSSNYRLQPAVGGTAHDRRRL